MNTIAKEIRSGLLGFWDEQLDLRVVEDAIHVAYPLLMPDGWQVSFSLYQSGVVGRIYELSDNGRVLDYLDDCLVSGKKVDAIIKERCEFFNISLDGRCLIHRFSKAPSPLDIELFAEGLQSVSHLCYRAETPRIPVNNAKRNFKRIVDVEKFKYTSNQYMRGKIIEKINVDYVIDGRNPVACKIAERKNDILEFMELWGFRFEDLKKWDPRLKAMMVYNPDIGEWDGAAKRIGDEYCDLFSPYFDSKDIICFLKQAAA